MAQEKIQALSHAMFVISNAIRARDPIVGDLADDGAGVHDNGTFIMRSFSWDDPDAPNFQYGSFTVMWHQSASRITFIDGPDIALSDIPHIVAECLASLGYGN